MSTPYLSIVATSRNDDHGGNALWRTQHFINGLAAQAEKFEILIELILVDWNPLKNKKSLYEAIDWPKIGRNFQYRVIQVPNKYHNQFKSTAKLPLLQYIAKNIGIKRAKGKFILATNIDILFSNELMNFLKNNLKKGYVYRVTRFDIESDLPKGLTFQEMLQHIKTKIIRVNTRYGTLSYKDYLHHPSYTFYPIFYVTLTAFKVMYKRFKRIVIFTWGSLSTILLSACTGKWNIAHKEIETIQKKINKFFIKSRLTTHSFLSTYAIQRQTLVHYKLHTNACGDFTLMSSEDWYKLRGYPEFQLFSWHIDSILLYQAHFMNIKTKVLPTKCSIYHIEHGKGSGWTPEGEKKLFDRIKANNIEFIDDKNLHKIFDEQQSKHKQGQSIYYNGENWGGNTVEFLEEPSK